MKTNNTFGVHFILRRVREGQGTVYARISVNSTSTEQGLERKVSVTRTLINCASTINGLDRSESNLYATFFLLNTG